MNELDTIEALLIQCEKDLAALREMHQSLVTMEMNRARLDDYYRNQYLKNCDNFANNAVSYRILDEDSIWDVLSGHYEEKIKFLKSIVQTL